MPPVRGAIVTFRLLLQQFHLLFMRLFRFLLMPYISPDNFFIHSHRIDKVATGPKMVSP